MTTTQDTVSARDEIESMFYRYARGFDEHKLEQLAECFTEDARFFSGEWIEGRAAIRDRLTERRQMRADAGQIPRHVNTNISIERQSEDEATAYSYFALVVSSAEGISIDVAGTYEDKLVRQDGRWLIASRRISRDEP